MLAHERIGSLRQPTPRQRFIWLHAAGLSYDEIAETHAELTTRTVEWQIYHGRRRLRLAAFRNGTPWLGMEMAPWTL